MNSDGRAWMRGPHNSDSRKLEACRHLWNVHRKILRKKAIDLDQVSAEWAKQEAQKLASPGGRDDFEELCEVGCVPEILAAIVCLNRFRHNLEDFCERIVGRAHRRERTRRVLEKTIRALSESFPVLISTEDEDMRDLFYGLGQLPLSEVISGLQAYVDLLKFDETFTRETRARSFVEISKYLLAGYVVRATGRFCDKNVSGLLAELIGPPDFNEVAQRMWRSRNYQRLELNFSKAAELCYFMGIAKSSST